MKKAAAVLLCLVLVVALFGCAEKKKPGSNDPTNNTNNNPTNNQPNTTPNTNSGTGNNGTTNNGTTGNGTVNNGTNNGTADNGITGNGNKAPVMGDNGVPGSTSPTGGATGTATWEQMLENGRVHDSDGFLFDGENSAWA